MEQDARIFVAGHRGLVGGAIARCLRRNGFTNIVTRTSAELDLRRQAPVEDFFAAERPDYVFLAAAKVGGIHANAAYPADFIRDNLQIQTNVIDAAWRSGTRKLLFLGSSCIYPKFAPQPIREDALLTGPLEPTNESYALAKIAGIRMCQAYRRQYGFDAVSAMPTNLYGPGDNFHPENSHVIPALMRRFHEARLSQAPSVTIWGTGSPLREFLHVDDMAEACLFLMQNYSDYEHVNVGCGEDLSILELARLMARVTGYAGEILTDPEKPDGTPRKLMDNAKLAAMGWRPRIPLEEGLAGTYAWFCDHAAEIRG
ncbi:NAD-dependent epimerase/dehydratase [Desulfovibrio sp. X2]|uniref:GDP-L-fucose synthase n=1 Tax=Desulfovibrio sp. X2 TaxID=941449 RepID=UPI000358CF52|nr:GDP-L-fucose synthase [Desulfovibrio sp. X2]EPR37181.1 NAD-dependent epimerase/dehydratase [Desulfovibrio sp. X2]